MNPINRVNFGRRKVRHHVDSMKQVARQFLEVFDLADLVHFIDDAVQDGLDLLIGFLLKESPLAFQPALVAEKLFLVEIGDLSFFAFCDFHEGRTITPNGSTRKPLSENLIYGLRIGPAACCFHHLADEKSEVSSLALPILLDGFGIFFNDLRHDHLDLAEI